MADLRSGTEILAFNTSKRWPPTPDARPASDFLLWDTHRGQRCWRSRTVAPDLNEDSFAKAGLTSETAASLHPSGMWRVKRGQMQTRRDGTAAWTLCRVCLVDSVLLWDRSSSSSASHFVLSHQQPSFSQPRRF